MVTIEIADGVSHLCAIDFSRLVTQYVLVTVDDTFSIGYARYFILIIRHVPVNTILEVTDLVVP